MASHVDLPANSSAEAERTLPARTRLESHEIERVIAMSRFAVVYRAYDHATQQVVALKEYMPDALARRNSKGRVSPRTRGNTERFELGRRAFMDEAQLLARFDHASILRVLGVMDANGTAYRVMPFSPGPTLLEHRRALDGMPALDDFRQWLEGLLGALSTLHAKGCVHGSVVPHNILLRPGERPLLLDFDAVRMALDRDDPHGALRKATSGRTPPQRRRPSMQRASGPWTDLHALAASLHYGISGQLPEAPTEGNTKVHFEPFADIWQRGRGCSAMSSDMVNMFGALDACLADPSRQRPKTVAEFRHWLNGRGPTRLRLVVAGATGRGADPVMVEGGCAATTAGAATEAEVEDAAEAANDADTEGRREPAAVQNRSVALPAVAVKSTRSLPAPVDAEVPPLPDAAGVAERSALDPVLEALQVVREPVKEPDAEAHAHAHSVPAIGPGSEAVAQAPSEDTWAAAGPFVAVRAGPLHTAWPAGLALVMLCGVVAWWSGRSSDSPPLPPPVPEFAAASNVAPVAPEPRSAQAQLPSETVPPLQTPTPKPSTLFSTTTESPPAGPLEADPPAALIPRPPPAPSPPVSGGTQRTAAGRSLPSDPRQVCGERTGFALYQCMQLQCAKSTWSQHSRCVQLRGSETVH